MISIHCFLLFDDHRGIDKSVKEVANASPSVIYRTGSRIADTMSYQNRRSFRNWDMFLMTFAWSCKSVDNWRGDPSTGSDTERWGQYTPKRTTQDTRTRAAPGENPEKLENVLCKCRIHCTIYSWKIVDMVDKIYKFTLLTIFFCIRFLSLRFVLVASLPICASTLTILIKLISL